MTKKIWEKVFPPTPLLQALFLYESVRQMGYRKRDLKIEIKDDINLVITEGKKVLRMSTGKTGLKARDAAVYRNFLLEKWHLLDQEVPAIVDVKRKLKINVARQKLLDGMERLGMSKWRRVN